MKNTYKSAEIRGIIQRRNKSVSCEELVAVLLGHHTSTLCIVGYMKSALAE